MTQLNTKKATNLTLDQALIADARALQINLSSAAEEGIREAVARSKAKIWQADNKDALESSNRFVEKNGIPLSKHRRF